MKKTYTVLILMITLLCQGQDFNSDLIDAEQFYKSFKYGFTIIGDIYDNPDTLSLCSSYITDSKDTAIKYKCLFHDFGESLGIDVTKLDWRKKNEFEVYVWEYSYFDSPGLIDPSYRLDYICRVKLIDKSNFQYLKFTFVRPVKIFPQWELFTLNFRSDTKIYRIEKKGDSTYLLIYASKI